MTRKLFIAVIVGAFVFGIASVAMAQSGDVRGHIYLKKADGTKVPVEGARVDFYRTDVAGYQKVTSKKDGSYVHAGLLFIGTYTIAVSAPGATPKTRSDVRPGRGADIDFELDPGDGRVPTEAEAKASNVSAGATGAVKESAEEKAAREAAEAKLEALKASNAKAESSNVVVTTSFKEGNELIVAGRQASKASQFDGAVAKYDLAIAKFDEGINIDPDHPGAPALLTNKAIALTERGKNHFNLSVTSKGNPDKQKSEREAAKSDVMASAQTAEKAVTLINNAPEDVKTGPNYAGQKLAALEARAQAYLFMLESIDQTKVLDGEKAYNEYIPAITKPEVKDRANLEFARLLFNGGEYDKSIAKYQGLVATTPDSLEANYGLGLALVAVGAIASEAGDKAKIEEGLGYLQAFADKAPETDPRKKEVVDTIAEYKNSKNFKPAKPPTSRRRGN